MRVLERIAAARRNNQPTPPDAGHEAGRLAELRVARELGARLDGTGCALHARRRVPDLLTGQRREIDFVLTRPDSVVLLEIKNWSGDLHIDGDGRFTQRRRSGAVLDHGPVIADLIEKGRILRRLLRARCDQDVRVEPRVAFFNERLRMTGAIDRDVVTMWDALRDGLPARRRSSLKEKLWALLRQLFGFEERTGPAPAASEPIRALRRVLDSLGTWDQVELHGGRTLIGDLLADHPDHVLSHPDFGGRAGLLAIDVQVPRTLLDALIRSRPVARIHPRTGESRRLPLPSAPLSIHEAGQAEPTPVEWRRVTRIEVGYAPESRYVLPWSCLRPGLEVDAIVRRIDEHGLRLDIGAPRWGGLHIRHVDERYTPAEELPERFRIGELMRVVVLGADAEKRWIDLARIDAEGSSKESADP